MIRSVDEILATGELNTKLLKLPPFQLFPLGLKFGIQDGTDALHSSNVYGNLNSNFIVTDPTSNVNIALTKMRPMWY